MVRIYSFILLLLITFGCSQYSDDPLYTMEMKQCKISSIERNGDSFLVKFSEVGISEESTAFGFNNRLYELKDLKALAPGDIMRKPRNTFDITVYRNSKLLLKLKSKV